MYEPKGTHLIEVSQQDIAAAWRVVNRLAHRLGREDVDVTFIEAYASDVTGTCLHHSGGTRRMTFSIQMCDCNAYDGKGYHHPTCPAPYPSVHLIRVWENGYGQWKLADNTNKKVGLKMKCFGDPDSNRTCSIQPYFKVEYLEMGRLPTLVCEEHFTSFCLMAIGGDAPLKVSVAPR